MHTLDPVYGPERVGTLYRYIKLKYEIYRRSQVKGIGFKDWPLLQNVCKRDTGRVYMK